MSNKKKSDKSGGPKLIVISAPSGSGKSTLASMLIEKYDDKMRLSISHTTRPPRGKEKNGVHYFFLDEESFKTMIKNNALLEYAHVFNKNWYGTSKAFVEDTLKAGFSILFDIDVQGAKNIKKLYGKRCVTIFVHPPDLAELEKRLRKRGTESEEAITLRLKTAREEVKQAPDFDYELINADLNKTFSELLDILKKEGCL